MKNKTTSTFILNIDEKYHFFVEGKNSNINGPLYRVYHIANKRPTIYTANNFVEEYGIYEKIAVANFVNKAILDLTTLQTMDRRIVLAQDKFAKLQPKLNHSNYKKPKLNKQEKNDLIIAIDTYDEVLDLIKTNTEISYEEEFEIISKADDENKIEEIKEEIKETRKVVTEIKNTSKDVTAKQRVLKYE